MNSRAKIESLPITVRGSLIETLIGFNTLERHCNIATKALTSELEELEELMKKELESLDELATEAYFSDINDEYIEVAETLPRLQWYSQFLLAYSFFEQSLNTICTAFREDFSYPLSFKELSDQGISRARNYLVKVCGLTSPFDTPDWQEAKLFADIRNAIAHRNGFIDYLPNKSNSLYSRLTGRSDIELKQDVMDQVEAQLIFDRMFVLRAIGVYRSIISQVALSVGVEIEWINEQYLMNKFIK